MLSFKSFLLEATSIDDEQLGHLTHTKDIPHEDPSKAKEAVKLLHDFHNIRQGKSAGDTKATLKTDGGASIHVIHDKNGVGVSDKHRFKRGVIARTPQEIDQHFGHAPGYAAALKHVLKHGAEFVTKGHHVQGDLLFSPAEKVKRTAGGISATPNALTYTLGLQPYTNTSAGSGASDVGISISVDGGTTNAGGGGWWMLGASGYEGISNFYLEVPNASQQFYYLIRSQTIGAAASYITCNRYTMPNGGE